MLTEDELVKQLVDSGARLLVTVPDLLDKATAAAKRSGVEEIFVYGEAVGATPFASLVQPGGAAPRVAIDPAEDLVALPYSSGTTGLHKGVMLTHRNLVANIAQCTHPDVTPKSDDELAAERAIAVLPFFHIYGLVVLMNIPLFRGATVVTMPRFDLAQFLQTIQHYEVNRAWVVPPIVLALAKHPLVDEYDLSSLEYVNSGAAPLSAELEVACGKRLGCHMQQGYGLTETSPATHWSPTNSRTRCRARSAPPSRTPSAGSSTSSPSRTSRPASPGELFIRGPQVMKGYLNNPEATAHAIDADGWFHKRRCRSPRRGRLALDRRPDQGADQVEGLPDRPGPARGAAPHPPLDHGRCRDPGPRRGGRRDP